MKTLTRQIVEAESLVRTKTAVEVENGMLTPEDNIYTKRMITSILKIANENNSKVSLQKKHKKFVNYWFLTLENPIDQIDFYEWHVGAESLDYAKKKFREFKLNRMEEQ